MNKSLVVTASNWVSFIGSLKSNLKLGYGQCDKKYYQNGFYTAVLQQATDSAYLQALQKLIGEEEDGDCHKDTFLGVERRTEASESVKPIVIRTTPAGNEIKELFEQFVEPKDDAGIKLKRTPRKPKENK